MTKEGRRSGCSEPETGMIGQQSFKSPRNSSATNVGETCIDRISNLPDSIIQHILSFSLVHDAVKTSVLSKRWRSLWPEVPFIRFHDSPGQSGRRFEKFVDKTLRNYGTNKMEKIDISFEYVNALAPKVDECILFANERNVEQLRLCLSQMRYMVEEFVGYQLSQSIFSNSSLQVLETSFCHYKVSGFVSWTSLKVLTIKFTTLDDDTIAKLLLGSPKLEYLKLLFIGGVNKIAVSSSNYNLKEIVISNWGLSTSPMEISGPNIRSLGLLGLTEKREIKLSNLSSLVEFKLGLHKVSDAFPDNEFTVCLTQLLAELGYVQKLTIVTWFLEVIARCNMPSPLDCKMLIVDTSINKWDFQGIVNLLISSPHLEKLTINMYSVNPIKFDDNPGYWESMKTDVKCDHLKIVKITGFERSWFKETRLKFFTSVVEFLLKNAVALEKIIIYAQSDGVGPDLSEPYRLITRFPRASANVVVEFKTLNFSRRLLR